MTSQRPKWIDSPLKKRNKENSSYRARLQNVPSENNKLSCGLQTRWRRSFAKGLEEDKSFDSSKKMEKARSVRYEVLKLCNLFIAHIALTRKR